MKKKFKIWFLVFFSLLILAGCQKPTDPKEATEVLVNGIIYQQDVAKVAELFSLNELKEDQHSETDFIEEIDKILPLDKKTQTELTNVYEENEKEFRELTSFTVKSLENEKGKAELEISITGLKPFDDEALVAQLDQALETGLKDITAETTEQEVETLVNQLSYEVLLASLNAKREVKEAEKVKLALMVDAADKTKWTIQNEDTFMTDLITAFGQ